MILFNELLLLKPEEEKVKAGKGGYYPIGLSGLNEAYGVDEPSYSMEDIKKINLRFTPLPDSTGEIFPAI